MTYLGVCHPTARLYLIAVQPPVLQLLLKQWPAHISRVVKLTSAIVVQDLGKHTWVPREW